MRVISLRDQQAGVNPWEADFRDRADIWSEKEIVFIRNEAKVTGRVGCVK